MPIPSQTTATQINNELGKSSSSILRLNDANTRNLAVKSSGAIKFGDCRWGINIPGGVCDNIERVINYNFNSELNIQASQFSLYDPPSSSASATAAIYFRSNGQMSIIVNGGAGDQNIFNRTWLTSGNAGDYTIQLQKISGTTPGGSAVNTDLVLSTTRSWSLSSSIGPPGPGIDNKSLSGNLILKDSSGTLITRPFFLASDAEVSL